MGNIRRLAATATIIVSISSCAALPTKEKVESFGVAASSSATAMKEALNANRLLALQTSKEREATAFIRGESYLLRMNEIDRENLLEAQNQLAILAALGDYASALAKSADEGVVRDLEAASAKLGTATGTLGAAAVPTAAPVIGPAFKLGGRLLGYALGSAYAAEIQAIITARDPTIQEIANTMPASLNAVARFVNAQVDDYEIKKQELLDALREKQEIHNHIIYVDRSQLYKEYLVARSDVETLQAQADALRHSETLFKQLAKAHNALAKGDPEASALVSKFAATASELVELIASIRA